jgi:hypothetical protein
MFDEKLQNPMLGAQNQIYLKYDRELQKVVIVWPDETQYILRTDLLAQYEVIKHELKQLDISKKYTISQDVYTEILYNEFQDLMVYFGLLNIDLKINRLLFRYLNIE